MLPYRSTVAVLPLICRALADPDHGKRSYGMTLQRGTGFLIHMGQITELNGTITKPFRRLGDRPLAGLVPIREPLLTTWYRLGTELV